APVVRGVGVSETERVAAVVKDHEVAPARVAPPASDRLQVDPQAVGATAQDDAVDVGNVEALDEQVHVHEQVELAVAEPLEQQLALAAVRGAGDALRPDHSLTAVGELVEATRDRFSLLDGLR